MHRQVEGDERRCADLVVAQVFAREVTRNDLDAGVSQPRRWRCQAEGLTPEIVGGQQENHLRILGRIGLVGLALIHFVVDPVMLTFTCALVQQHWKPPPPSPDRSFAWTRTM